MILFHSEKKSKSKINIKGKLRYKKWIRLLLLEEKKIEGEINFIFCDDDYLLVINKQYLQHDTLTDIITFDYSEKQKINGDIFISVERVKMNASEYKVSLREELLRVMAHGILHLCGYKDKTAKEIMLMRTKEDNAIKCYYEMAFHK